MQAASIFTMRGGYKRMTNTGTGEKAVSLSENSGMIGWIIRRRWVIIAFTIVIVAGAGSGMEKLQFSSDYRDFFEDDNPKLMAFEALQDKFVRSNNVFLAIESKIGNLYTEKGLKTLIRLSDELWTLPYVIRVDSVANFQFVDADADDIKVWDLTTDSLPLSDKRASFFHQRALNEKSINGYLVVEDSGVSGINISLADAVTTEAGKVEFMASLNQLLDQFTDDSLEFYKTGALVIDHGFDVSAQSDLEIFYALVYLLVLILVYVMTRAIWAVVGVLLSVTFSWVIALGIAGLVGVKLTAISVAAPTVLMTLAVAQSMHILFSVQKHRAENFSKREAVYHALTNNIWPLFLVSFSTTIGFLAIMSSEVPPLQDLGFILSVGTVAVFLLSVTFLPAFLSFFSLNKKNLLVGSSDSLGKLGGYIALNSNRILVMGGIISALLVSPILLNEINDNFIEYFDENNSVRSDSEYVDKNLTGVHQIYFEIESNSNSTIFEPAYLSYVEQLTTWLEQQPEVRHISSFTEVLKRLQRATHGGIDSEYQLPVDRNTAAQLFLMYEMSLPLGLTTSNLVDVKQSSTRLTMVLGNLTSSEILSLDDRIRDWHLSQDTNVILHAGTGPTIMFADIGQRNAKSLVSSSVLALVLVSIILLIALRSIKLSVISLIPNLLPALLAFGIWGIIDGEVGLAISIVAIMTFGIVVDDTIYFMTHFKKNLALPSFEICTAETFKQVGAPIVSTTIILVAGFSVLAFSDFRLNQGMGMLTAMVIFIALICDMALLPGLLKKFVYKVQKVES